MPDADTPTEFEPITTQEAADAYVASHLPDDYQHAIDRAAQLEKDLADSQRALAASQVAAATGVPVEALTGTTREELEASASLLRQWRDQTAPKPKRPPLHDTSLKSGAASSKESLSPKAAAAAALRAMRGHE